MVGYFLARKQLSEICHIVAEVMHRESIYNRICFLPSQPQIKLNPKNFILEEEAIVVGGRKPFHIVIIL
jgi:hypothetical protein